MRVIEKEWRSGNHIGTALAYADVEPELLEFLPRIRVLPARWFYEKKLYFEFHKRYEPGENKHFPNGGFHVRDSNGAGYYFDLDQVIVHPSIIIAAKNKIKWDKRVERVKEKNEIIRKRIERSKSGEVIRGRPPLSEEARRARDLEKKERTIRSGGKRGRPRKGEERAKVPHVPSGNGRGRPPLDPVLKAQRDAEKLAKLAANKGVPGKRGRPSNPERQKQREAEAAAKLALNPTKRRGRPAIHR